MKRFFLAFFCIAGITGGIFYAISVPHDPLIHASDGVIDLRDAALEMDKNVYMLGGEWEFYWGRLYEPKDFLEGPREGKTLISVPGPWSSSGYQRTGHATYRLTILAPEGALMMFVPEITSAAVIWVNGEKIFSAG